MTVRPAAAPRPSALTSRAVLGVLLFWWGATGVIIALQRNGLTRVGAILFAVAAIPAALVLVPQVRDDRSEAGALWGFASGALLWSAISALFYGGWVVGATAAGAVPDGWWPRMSEAIAATWHSTALTAALAATVWALSREAPNRMPLLTLLLFWAAHEVARLNVFFGVVSPGAQYLPDYLAHLTRYFGPTRNSPFLPASVLAVLVGGVACLWQGRRAAPAGLRLGARLLGVVLILATFELLVLATPRTLGWWNLFLAWRAGS